MCAQASLNTTVIKKKLEILYAYVQKDYPVDVVCLVLETPS